VLDNNVFEDGRWRVLREISIYNATEHEIKRISGKVVFYDHKYKVDEVYFIEDVIPPQKGIRIDKLMGERKLTNWNEFHTEIVTMEHCGGEVKNIKLYGIYIVRTYFLILNRFNYIRVFGRRVLPYEITWLRTTSRYLWRRLMFLPPLWSETEGRDIGLFWIRLSKRFLKISLFLFFVCCLIYAIGSFCIVMLKIITCWSKAISLILTGLRI